MSPSYTVVEVGHFVALVDCGKWISTIRHWRYVKHQTLLPSLKLTSSHLKMDGWERILFFLGRLGLFSGAFAVSLRGGSSPHF